MKHTKKQTPEKRETEKKRKEQKQNPTEHETLIMREREKKKERQLPLIPRTTERWQCTRITTPLMDRDYKSRTSASLFFTFSLEVEVDAPKRVSGNVK